MKIVETQEYIDTLLGILEFIAKDKKSIAIDFNKRLRSKIKTLKDFPFMYRKSIYFDDDNIRDLIYKGYVIPYKVDIKNNTIYIIGITKYKDKL